MSTAQQKIIRQQARIRRQGKIPRVADPSENNYFNQRHKYPEIYGKMPLKVINKLKELKIIKEKSENV